MSAENTQNPEEEKPEKPKITTEEIAETLRSEPRFQEYFKGFRPDSVDSFIDSYARNKKLWLDFGPFYGERTARAETRWMDAAAQHLTYILQKKLFDAQCLWRAEQATYEGVEISYDFMAWSEEIEECPFIEPITEEDVECYRQFLLSPNATPNEMRWLNWQDYEEIKEGYHNENGNGYFPEWYAFHNSRTGSSGYLMLPDLRGEKEDRYRKLEYKEREEANREVYEEARRNQDPRPSMHSCYDDEFLHTFVKTFEDADTYSLYKAFKYANRHSDEEETLRATIEVLLNADEVIPIEAHHDFRQALREAERRYELGQIAAHLPIAYEEYQINRSLGLRSPSDGKKFLRSLSQDIRKYILRGRVLAGEPENFDF